MFTYYDLIPRFSVQNIKNIIRYFKDNIKQIISMGNLACFLQFFATSTFDFKALAMT